MGFVSFIWLQIIFESGRPPQRCVKVFFLILSRHSPKIILFFFLLLLSEQDVQVLHDGEQQRRPLVRDGGGQGELGVHRRVGRMRGALQGRHRYCVVTHPTANGGTQGGSSRRNVYTSRTRFLHVWAADLHAQPALIDKSFSVGAQSEVFFKVALLVGQELLCCRYRTFSCVCVSLHRERHRGVHDDGRKDVHLPSPVPGTCTVKSSRHTQKSDDKDHAETFPAPPGLRVHQLHRGEQQRHPVVRHQGGRGGQVRGRVGKLRRELQEEEEEEEMTETPTETETERERETIQ